MIIAKRRQKFYRSRFSAIVFLASLFAAYLPLTIFAKPLADYRKNVETSQDAIMELLYPNDEDAADQDYSEFERKTVADIRAKLPASEKIEWQNSSVETNNQWLVDKLDLFEKEPRDSAKREAILTEIDERLEAIGQKIAELENPAATARTKDEDKRKLAEILRREDYQKPAQAEESIFQKLYRQFMEWLGEKFPRPNLPNAAPDGFQTFSFALQILLYALLLGIIGFLIRRFAPFLFERFQNREKKQTSERVILGERLAADETARNLFNEAERLARTGDLRGAIRKGYIALLCELSDKKIIGLSRHKTNRDYLRDVRKRQKLYENMNGLTLNFERHWYGFETPNEADWKEFKDGYERIITN